MRIPLFSARCQPVVSTLKEGIIAIIGGKCGHSNEKLSDVIYYSPERNKSKYADERGDIGFSSASQSFSVEDGTVISFVKLPNGALDMARYSMRGKKVHIASKKKES